MKPPYYQLTYWDGKTKEYKGVVRAKSKAFILRRHLRLRRQGDLTKIDTVKE